MSGFVDHLLSLPAWVALLIVFAIPALESSAFLGFVFPGETVVILGGVMASLGRAPLAAMIAAAVVGAILGDAIGYGVGHRWGRQVLDSTLGRFVDARHLDRAEEALRRRGAWAVFVGRFTVALRVMVPGLAGMSRLPLRTFLPANVAGGIAWGATMVTAGYLAGTGYKRIEHDASLVGLAQIARAHV